MFSLFKKCKHDWHYVGCYRAGDWQGSYNVYLTVCSLCGKEQRHEFESEAIAQSKKSAIMRGERQ